MANWKENKVVGVVAGAVLVIALVVVVSTVAKSVKTMPKVKIDTTQEIPGPGVIK